MCDKGRGGVHSQVAEDTIGWTDADDSLNGQHGSTQRCDFPGGVGGVRG
jgi:hypothetical protein